MYNSQLTTFVQVADSGSFNKAAEALYISSTAVIKQINALEKHLDLTLFSRTNHGIALTESGRIIYKHARKLFAYSEKKRLRRPVWPRQRRPQPSAWGRPSSTPANHLWTFGTGSVSSCLASSSTLSPLRTTTRNSPGDRGPGGEV